MPTLSACLIVRDEEHNLEACLQALGPWVDELCVLDTGSRDRSLQIAAACGARLGRFEWCDDFAAARNACLELATGDWILSVDADELLDPESAAGLGELLRDETAQAYLVWLDNLDGGRDPRGRPSFSSVGLTRLFRRRPEIRWSRPVHESVTQSLLELGLPTPEHSHLRLVHHGYLPEAVRSGQKRERNLALLEGQARAQPGDLFNAYKLASTYASLGRAAEACERLDGTWRAARELSEGARAQLPFLPLVAADLIRLHQSAGRASRAWQVAEQGLADFPTVSEVVFQAAEVQRRCGRLERAGELYVAARECEPWTDLYAGDPATRRQLPLLGLARVAALAGDLDLAGNCARRALELAPQNLEARALAARLDAVRGDEQRAWGALDRLLSEAPGQAHVLLLAAELAWARGESETALGFWRGALRDPVSESSARAWLVVADLVGGDLEGAALRGGSLRAVDLPEAGTLALLAGVTGEAFRPDPLLDLGACLGELSAWLVELARDPERRALTAFARGASSLEVALPGAAGLRVSG
jgi:tetratricopeptide (TPR) repeat protein